MTYRLEDDGTWSVLCEEEHVVETGYLALAYAAEDFPEVTAEHCADCSERIAEAQSGIPREYAEC